ncbi:DUF3499 domain-containing protein [Mycobacterium bourgelatii]|nr:DUF3499 domain-containing protein [Mycobacterium bourgelatii]MCV6973498.1 DUF3499 domain-containing protein [Mycobacterium bourgelatii]
MNVPRRCCRPGCPHYAVATLTFVYSDSTAVVGPLATAREPHSWDLCVGHAGRITAPRGWELMRHAGPLPTYPHPEEDDLVALADAVREGGPSGRSAETPYSGFSAAHGGANGMPLNGFTPRTNAPPGDLRPAGTQATAPNGSVIAPPEHRSGRRRGHLRVLPDPSD